MLATVVMAGRGEAMMAKATDATGNGSGNEAPRSTRANPKLVWGCFSVLALGFLSVLLGNLGIGLSRTRLEKTRADLTDAARKYDRALTERREAEARADEAYEANERTLREREDASMPTSFWDPNYAESRRSIGAAREARREAREGVLREREGANDAFYVAQRARLNIDVLERRKIAFIEQAQDVRLPVLLHRSGLALILLGFTALACFGAATDRLVYAALAALTAPAQPAAKPRRRRQRGGAR